MEPQDCTLGTGGFTDAVDKNGWMFSAIKIYNFEFIEVRLDLPTLFKDVYSIYLLRNSFVV